MDTKSGAVRFETYEEFMNALSKAFDDPDATATAAREIRRLRQKDGTCADYYAKFVTLAARLGWNTEAQIEQFKYGLNEELRRALTYRDDPTGNTLEDHARVCIMIDNKQRAFEASRRNNRRKDKSKKDKTQKDDSFRPFRPSAPAPTNPSVVGEPMDLSTARFKLTPQERERRRANNLCLRCGGQGHVAANCKSGPPKNNRGLQQVSPPRPRKGHTTAAAVLAPAQSSPITAAFSSQPTSATATPLLLATVPGATYTTTFAPDGTIASITPQPAINLQKLLPAPTASPAVSTAPNTSFVQGGTSVSYPAGLAHITLPNRGPIPRQSEFGSVTEIPDHAASSLTYSMGPAPNE